MKVKIFRSMFEDELEMKINNFIEEIEKQHMEVKNIKFEVYNNDCKALVMYGPDGKIYLHTGTLGGENV